MKVLCLWHATEDEISSIKKAMPSGTEVVAAQGEYFSRFDCSYSDVAQHAADAVAILAFSLPKGLLEIAKKLKYFGWLHAGCDELGQSGALSLFKQRGVKLTNIRGANAIAVAEHAMMFVLALAKKTILKHQLALEWHKPLPLYDDQYRAGILDGRTIGIIGVGQIGGRVAKYAKGFDMHVLGIRRNKERALEHVDSMHGMDELHSVLAKCDYVVLAAPITDETYQFFGKDELKAMKPSAYLINIARGDLVQEKPLYEALTTGRLRGFAADVWPRYEYSRHFATACPAVYGPRLQTHRLPNVTSSHDQAANADDVLERYIQWGIQSLVEFATDKPITREVNLDLGY